MKLAIYLFWLPLAAQWLNQPTAGIPRTPDGKPNLSAPVPKSADGKPDLSGIWTMNPGPYAMNITTGLKAGEVPASVEVLYNQRREDLGKDSPFTACLPQGPVMNLNPVAMSKFVQTPGLILILSEDLTYRQIFLDGRSLPKDPNPSFMGYSIGHWDGDTLVVESNGFNERTWLDFGGHPHSEELRITERFHRRDLGHMDIEETISDPKFYSQPWNITIHAGLITDTEMLETVCAENEKDRQHLVGKASDDQKKAVKVAPQILAKYVGTYDFRFPENPTQPVMIHVTMSGGELAMDFLGGNKPLIPLSETLFSSDGFPYTFVTNDRGEVTHFLMQAAEGDLKAVKVK